MLVKRLKNAIRWRLVELKWWLFRLPEHFQKRRLKRAINLRESEAEEITVVAMCRNEAMRLPYFFEYYKDLGVSRFLVLDHESTDTTQDVIRAEPLATRIPIEGNFVFKRAWLTAILEAACRQCWTLVLDADEILIWPEYDRLSLKGLTEILEDLGFDALSCTLLDMYPKGPVDEAIYRPGQNPIEVAPYFSPTQAARERVFGVSPLMCKTPVFKFGKHHRLERGQHRLVGAKESTARACLLHFKFLSDFKDKIRTNPVLEMMDQPYGEELKAYQSKVDKAEPIVLHNEDSVRFRDAAQLVELELMKRAPELSSIVAAKDDGS